MAAAGRRGGGRNVSLFRPVSTLRPALMFFSTTPRSNTERLHRTGTSPRTGAASCISPTLTACWSLTAIPGANLRLPGKSFVRSVSVDSRGTVYVGGVGEFGLLKPDATGTMTFVSLIDQVPQTGSRIRRRLENPADAARGIFQHL